MDELITLLNDIIGVEHAQRLKCVYLTSLGCEFESDQDDTLIVVANNFDKFAEYGGDLFTDLVIDRIIGFYHRTGQKFPNEKYAPKLKDYLDSIFDEATGSVLKQLGDDTNRILKELPELSRQYVVNDIENTVRGLWATRNNPQSRSALEFYKSVYEWLTSSDTISGWDKIYDSYNPNWAADYKEDWQSELDVGEQYQPTMSEIFEDIKLYEQEPTPAEELQDTQESVDDVIEQPIPEPEKAEMPEPVQEQVQAPEQALESTPDTRRPITKSIEDKFVVYDPSTQKKTLEVGVGDKIYNQSAKMVFKQYKDEYGLTPEQINSYSVGEIKEIRNDGSVIVEVPGAKDPFNEQIWDINTDRLWGNREKGQRVVNKKP
jgi:hypothetical protein